MLNFSNWPPSAKQPAIGDILAQVIVFFQSCLCRCWPPQSSCSPSFFREISPKNKQKPQKSPPKTKIDALSHRLLIHSSINSTLIDNVRCLTVSGKKLFLKDVRCVKNSFNSLIKTQRYESIISATPQERSQVRLQEASWWQTTNHRAREILLGET